MGKGSRRRKGDTGVAYRSNDEYWSQVETKKESDCWKCRVSYKCDNAYKTKLCIGFKSK